MVRAILRALSGFGTRRLLADMKAAQRPSGINTAAIHGGFRPDDVTKRQSGWLRRFWVRKDAPGHVLKL